TACLPSYQCSQSDSQRADRIGTVSSGVLSRRTDAVQSRESRTRPPVSTSNLEQTRSRSIHRRDGRHAIDNAVRFQRRDRRCIIDTAPCRLLMVFPSSEGNFIQVAFHFGMAPVFGPAGGGSADFGVLDVRISAAFDKKLHRGLVAVERCIVESCARIIETAGDGVDLSAFL